MQGPSKYNLFEKKKILGGLNISVGCSVKTLKNYEENMFDHLWRIKRHSKCNLYPYNGAFYSLFT